MKNLIVLIFLVSILSCKDGKHISNEKLNVTEEKDKNSGDVFMVTGKVTQSSSYCGGARPTDEMLNSITAPRPMVGTTYYVRKGTTNDVTQEIVMTFSTGTDGSFSFKLPPGDYIIIDANRLDSSYVKSIAKKYEKPTASYTEAKKDCLNEWLKGGMFQFKIIDAPVSNIEWNINHSCWTDDPCVHYTGPYPP